MKLSIFLLPVIAVLTAGAPLAAAFGAANSPVPDARARDAASARRPPLVIHNSDGTMTVQLTPSPAQPGAKEGLVIPPQVVVPLIPRR
jgi:hypothetical protein